MANLVIAFVGLSGVVSVATVVIGYMAEKAYRARHGRISPRGRHTVA